VKRRISLSILIVIAGATAAAASDQGLSGGSRPAGNEPPGNLTIPGWSRSGPEKTYSQRELYGYIDGGAEIFLELGFETLRLQRFESEGDRFTVEIYAMTDPAAALGVYLSYCGRENRNQTFGERHTVGRYQLLFVKGCHYVNVKNDGGREARVPDLIRFGGAIAAGMPPGESIPELEILPTEGRLDGSERLIRGPFGLQSIFTLGEGDVLRLRGAVTALSAQYTLPGGGSYTRIRAPFPTKAAAQETFRHLTSHLDPYLEVLSRDRRRVVFKDHNGRFGEILLDAPRIDLRLHLNAAP